MSFLYISRSKRKSNKYDDSKIKDTFLEIFFYLLFLINVCMVAFGLAGPSLYYFSRTMRELFIERVFVASNELELNFATITIIDELWLYVDNVLMLGLFGDENKDIQENVVPEQKTLILNENLVVGPARFRQIRVRNNSCTIHKLFEKHFSDCYGFYTTANEDFSPMDKISKVWHYEERDPLTEESISWGILTTYPGGGYIQELSLYLHITKDVIENLKSVKWIDRGTRVLFIEFTIFNMNTNLFSIAKLIFEIPPSGGIIPTYSIRTLKLFRFLDNFDYIVLICEILLAIQTIWYTIEELYELTIEKFDYFKSFWNWIDLSIITISYTTLSFSIIRYVLGQNKIARYDKERHDFISFGRLGYWQMQYNNLMAILVFLVWVKILKFINFNKSMLQFSATLQKCAKDLLGFGVMFFIVFVAFAQLGFMLFGTENKDFKTFKIAIFTLLRTILGDFDYVSLEQTNRILGPIYFLSFIFFVFFVLLNMFLAIINDTYSEVKSQPDKDVIHLVKYVRDNFNKIIGKIYRSKNKGLAENDDKFQSLNEDIYPLERKFGCSNINDQAGRTEIENQVDENYINLSNRVTFIEITINDIIFKLDSLIRKLETKQIGKKN